MLRSMYAGVSGLRNFQTKLDVIGNNIANVNTVGFKASRVMFSDILSQTIGGATTPEEGVRGGRNPRQVGLGSTIASIDTIHTPGSPMTTGIGKDLSIDGNGFFVVMDQNGSTFLTRAGNFMLDAANQLVTPQGYFVLSIDGDPVVLDENAESYSVSANGQIIQVVNGEEVADGPQIGIAIVRNPEGLKKVGGSMYQLTPNADPAEDATELLGIPGEEGRGETISGQLEMSNVDLSAEFTEMIVAQRGFQANSRIITTSDEILQELVNLKR